MSTSVPKKEYSKKVSFYFDEASLGYRKLQLKKLNSKYLDIFEEEFTNGNEDYIF
jgi:hypothetical protein